MGRSTSGRTTGDHPVIAHPSDLLHLPSSPAFVCLWLEILERYLGQFAVNGGGGMFRPLYDAVGLRPLITLATFCPGYEDMRNGVSVDEPLTVLLDAICNILPLGMSSMGKVDVLFLLCNFL